MTSKCVARIYRDQLSFLYVNIASKLKNEHFRTFNVFYFLIAVERHAIFQTHL